MNKIDLQAIAYEGKDTIRFFSTPYDDYFNLSDLCRIFDLDFDDADDFVCCSDKLRITTYAPTGWGTPRTFIDLVGLCELLALVSEPANSRFRTWFQSAFPNPKISVIIDEEYYRDLSVFE